MTSVSSTTKYLEVVVGDSFDDVTLLGRVILLRNVSSDDVFSFLKTRRSSCLACKIRDIILAASKARNFFFKKDILYSLISSFVFLPAEPVHS